MLKIKSVAEMLCIPFIVFLYLVPDDLLLWKSIWSPETDWNTNITFARTKTKTTINGGTIYRQNAFIDLREASMKRGTDGPE